MKKAIPVSLTLLVVAALLLLSPPLAAQSSADLAIEPRTVFRQDHDDPTGDTFGNGPDIVEITNRLEGDHLEISLRFVEIVAPPLPPHADSIVGTIDIDVDQDGTTGSTSSVASVLVGAANGMGVEYRLVLADYRTSDETIAIRNEAQQEVGRAPVVFQPRRMTVAVPVALINDDGFVNVAARVGAAPSFVSDIAPDNGSVSSGDPAEVLLLDGRFRATVDWATPSRPLGPARASQNSTGDSGLFYFRNADNLEFLVKIIDGCTNNGFFWVFFAATTNVEFTLTVTDTQTTTEKSYQHDFGTPADAVTDVTAFATCP